MKYSFPAFENGFVRVAAATPALRVADCAYNAQQIIDAMRVYAAQNVQLVCFPEFCLTGYTCSDLFLQHTLLQGAEDGLAAILDASTGLNLVALVGLPVAHDGKLYNCAAALAGATVIANLSASDETIGKAAYRRQLISGQSARLLCAYLYADAGHGESTTDMTFAGHNLIAENGTLLAETAPFEGGTAMTELDLDRHYTVAQYMDLVDYAREKIPGVTFSSDIIVGFPGETEEDFQATLDLVRKVGYMQLFTFIYSKRTGTPAAKFDDPTTHAEKAARMERLLKTQDEFAFAATAAMAGQTVRVLVEAAGRTAGTVNGRLDNNLVVEFQAPESLIGQWANVHLTGSRAALLVGELVQD